VGRDNLNSEVDVVMEIKLKKSVETGANALNNAVKEFDVLICLNCNEEVDSYEGHHCVNDLPLTKEDDHDTHRFLIWAIMVGSVVTGIIMWRWVL